MIKLNKNVELFNRSVQQTVIRPFDGYTWAFLLMSVVAMAVTLSIIDSVNAREQNLSQRDIFYHGMFD